MGSNAVNLEEEDLCCPVCRKPLYSPGKPPKPKLNKFGRGKSRTPYFNSIQQAQRDTRMALGKLKESEDVVVAQCGHLFHKFCLRHYCYLFREGRANHMCRITCPWCDKRISMSSQLIDYRAHQDKLLERDKDMTKTSIMNNELAGQMKSVQHKLQNVEDAIDDGNHNFELYRTHWRKLRKELKNVKSKRLEIENMYSEIERSEKMLKCMQSQQLKIVKKFVMKVKEKHPKDFIHFPRRLAPYLHFIEEDDKLIRDLGEIIVPIHLNHLKSDRHSLLKGIIAAVEEKLLAEGKSIEPAPVVVTDKTPRAEQQVKACDDQPPKKPAFYVKVRKSSISILSSTTLTRESIQQIIQTIKIPFHGATKRQDKASGSDRRKGRLVEKISNNRVDNVSTSDIKILYMPKRKVFEQYSEPCRIREDTESFVEIPARRCKSTDAVLVKTKKKTAKSSCRSRAKISPRNSQPLEDKRSSTAAIMSTKWKNADNVISLNNETSPTTVAIIAEKENETPPVGNDEQNSPLEGERSSAAAAITSTKWENTGGVILFDNETCPTTVAIPKKEENEAPPVNNGQQLEMIEKVKEIDCVNNSNNLDRVASAVNPESNLSPKVIKIFDLVPDPPADAPAPPIETASMLKLIYDNLEEEHKSTHALETQTDKIEYTDVDENNNDLLLQSTPRKDVFSTALSVASESCQPVPQFFRVDRRGIARPESPHLTQFRQPTFLSTIENTNRSDRSLTICHFQPNEENQLNALSSDDKLLIVSEHEEYRSSFRNCNTSERRPMFHGTPACLGIPDKQFHFGAAPPVPHGVPIYLKKWQQQLTSRKILKAAPKRFPHNASLHSTRLLKLPKDIYPPYCNSELPSCLKAVSQNQQQADKETLSSSARGIHLPPLLMYPSKRPSTAQCENMPESYNNSNDIMGHREGPDLEIPRVYDDDSVWK